MDDPKILILTVPHGASHERLASALSKALVEIQPALTIRVVNALEHYTRWFRLYYNSYKIPLKYWPALWGWIESIQHASKSTNPAWLYRRGGEPLSQYIRDFRPDVVIATEVGLCELAALLKRESSSRFYLVAAPTDEDIDRAWVQPEVDLYTVPQGQAHSQLDAAGVPPAKILPCGLPVDPAFDSLPDRAIARARLGLDRDSILLLVLFGGTGMGNCRWLFPGLEKILPPLEVVFIAGKNRQLEQDLTRLIAASESRSRFRAFGWVNNIHEWMAAADLLVSKPGATTVIEAINASLPLLAVNPLAGGERRIGKQIEKWGVGYSVRFPEVLAPTIERLLANPLELEGLRQNARKLARPRAAHEAAEAILKLVSSDQ